MYATRKLIEPEKTLGATSGMDFAGVQRSAKRLRLVVELPSITAKKIVYKA